MKERNSIQKEYEGSREDLLKQYQSGDISKSLYDAETEALQDALNKRLEIQNDYYKQQDELQSDYSAGLISGLQRRLLLRYPQCSRLGRNISAA